MIDKKKLFSDFEIVRNQHGLTFIDIEKIFTDNGFNYRGSGFVSSDSLPHVAFWSGWNDSAIELLQEYISKYNLCPVPVRPEIYYMNGKYPILPVINIFKKNYSVNRIENYKRDHWIPVEIE